MLSWKSVFEGLGHMVSSVAGAAPVSPPFPQGQLHRAVPSWFVGSLGLQETSSGSAWATYGEPILGATQNSKSDSHPTQEPFCNPLSLMELVWV